MKKNMLLLKDYKLTKTTMNEENNVAVAEEETPEAAPEAEIAGE